MPAALSVGAGALETPLETSIPVPRARRLLWLAFVLALPLPFYALQVGFAPPLRMLFIGSLVLGVFASGPEATAALFLGFFMGQGLLWLGVTYLLARLGSRLLGLGGSGSAGGGEIPAHRLYAVLGALVLIAMFPIYRLPYSSGEPVVSWLGLFQ